ncbi:MAG: Rrf2 family transcriptional regulator [Rhizomicrobium sp.]
MLSQKAKYALKALLALAQSPGGELLQCGEIAAQENIPKKFLDLILLELRKHGVIDSVRGKHGGYILLRPAGKITIGDIIRIVDGPLAPIACASVTGYRRCKDCKNESACMVRLMMRDVRDAASGILDQMTLADAAEAGRARDLVLKRRKRVLSKAA